MLEFFLGILIGVVACTGVYSTLYIILWRKAKDPPKAEIQADIRVTDTDDEEERLYKLNKQWQNLMEYTGVKQDD